MKMLLSTTILASLAAISYSAPLTEFSVEGQQCGGLLGQRCAPSLTCHMPARSDSGTINDNFGICIKTVTKVYAQLGETCGTIVGIECQKSLRCKLATNDVADAAGICVTRGVEDHHHRVIAKEGQPCGGIMGVHCDHSLHCKRISEVVDAVGLCVPVSQPGQICGGNKQTSPVCATFSVCRIKVKETGEGVCESVVGVLPEIRHISNAGERCGGNMMNAPICADTLYCDFNGQTNPDVGGVCRQKFVKAELFKAKIGDKCGGNMANAAVCDDSLYCDFGEIHPDAGGICKSKTGIANLGERCGGFMTNAPVCAESLFCDVNARVPDGGGVCRQRV